MAYQFNNEVAAKMSVTMSDSTDKITLAGVNGRETDANVIMGGISTLLGIVNWSARDAARIVTQNVEETT